MTRSRRRSPEERRQEHAAVEDPEVVMAAAARFLETRSRSEDEVRRRLRSAGYPEPLVETVIQRLVQLGYVDDDAFARAWIASRDRAHPRGERALRVELLRKGVSTTSIDQALADRGTSHHPGSDMMTGGISGADTAVPPAANVSPGDPADGPEVDAARRLLARHRPALSRVADPRRRRQRTWALLARHGFGPDAIRQVMAMSETSDPGETDDDSAADDPRD